MRSPFSDYNECKTEFVIGILHLGKGISRLKTIEFLSFS